MTMIDEHELRAALADAADAFTVSDDAAQRILTAAAPVVTTPRIAHVATFARRGRTRNILAAVAAIVVLGAVSIPLMQGGQPQFNALKAAARVDAGQTGSHPGASSASPSSSLGAFSTTGASTGLTVSEKTSNVGPRIESSGSVHLRVDKGQVSPTLSKLSGLATADGGYVLSSHATSAANGSGNFTSAAIVLQVPQHRFTTLLSQVQRVGHATAIESTSTNVTSQYVDLHARIAALEASRQQYLTIMSKATTIGGILAVQNQLDSIQSQIEHLQGQMNVLDHATSYATLSVAVATVGSVGNGVAHHSGIAAAWHDSIGGFVTGVEWLIRIAGPMLFMALLLGALLVIGRVIWRATQRRRM